jgi:hypothetical protein
VHCLSIFVEEQEMEQGLVAMNTASAMPTASTATSESNIEQQSTDETMSSVVAVLPCDDMMDLLRAIEMSRLQAVRENEQNIFRPHMNSAMSSVLHSNSKMDYFDDLQHAIELSMMNTGEEASSLEAAGSCRSSSLKSSSLFPVILV